MDRPLALVFLGDMQTGGTTALTPPDFWLESIEEFTRLNDKQKWLLDCWLSLSSDVSEIHKTYDVGLMLGGDLIDGPMHHGTHQTRGTRSEMRDMAVKLLQPFTDIAACVYSVDGTEAHAGEEGDDDNSISKQVGALYRPHWRMKVQNRWLDWKHDGMKLSKRPHLADAALFRAAQDEYWGSLELGREPASLIVRHHSHRTRKVVETCDVKVAICGCWQLSTHHAAAFYGDLTPVTIGGIVWYPEEHHVKRINYEYKPPTETFALGRHSIGRSGGRTGKKVSGGGQTGGGLHSEGVSPQGGVRGRSGEAISGRGRSGRENPKRDRAIQKRKGN